MAKVTVSFCYDDETDKDLVRWFAGLPSRGTSEAIREAIRDHIGHTSVTLGDVIQAVRDLERKIKAGAGIVNGSPAEGGGYDEPPDVAAALDALAEL
ncbi:MAG: hypothetical protein JXA14_26630 [Anaerolineae bacterium]|nr:hypothetical protein [Anaerolineae bacterium]